MRTITLAHLPQEAAAGLSVAAVAIPIALAYAALTGVPPAVGLYASIFPMVAYAIFGPSRYLIVGPDTATCLLIASALATLGLTSAEDRAVAASALALAVGAGFALAALAKLGFVASLLSRPILVGYLGGVALTLLISQISNFTGVRLLSDGLLNPIVEIVRRGGEIHWLTLAIASGFFVLLRVLMALAPRLPAAAVVIVAAIALSWGLNWQSQGVAVIGTIPSGLPLPRLPDVGGKLAQLALPALGLLVVSFSSGILTARSFGEKLREQGDPNLELRGFAAANIAAGLFQGFSVTGADSRTAVNLASGGRTPLVAVFAALALGLVVTTLTAPLSYLPQAVLGAILASAAIGLVDVRGFVRLARIDRAELFFALVAMVGVIWFGVLQGVFLAMAVTLAHLLRLVARPQHSSLGLIPGGVEAVDLSKHPDAVPPADGVAFRFEASLLFMNADYFNQQALIALAANPSARWLLLDASLIQYGDSTAMETLDRLRETLADRGVRLSIAGARGRFMTAIERSGLARRLGSDAILHDSMTVLAHRYAGRS
jgi:high affinity sulfate transporter 1